MGTSERIKNYCKIVKFLMVVGMIVFPLSTILFPFILDDYFVQVSTSPSGTILKEDFGNLSILIYIVTDLFFSGFLVLVLWHVYNLFSRYQKMDFFSPQQVGRIKKISFSLLAFALSTLLVRPALSIVLSFNKEDFVMEFNVDSSFYLLLCASLIVGFLYLVMREANKIQTENKFTV